MNFQDMPLPSTVHQALKAMNFSEATPIQEQAIPLILEQRDLIACAQTGSGKTGAFSIPMVTRLLEHTGKTGLILAPTRELAVQILEVFSKLTLATPNLRVTLLIGGAPMQKQIRALAQRPRIIVATPGRLVDHLHQRTVSLAQTSMLVLDEADRMLDMGFAPQLNEILRHLPNERQTLLFSATLPDNIMKLASKYLKDPAHVAISSSEQAPPKIQHTVIETSSDAKNDVLLDQLVQRQGSVLIFARTKHRTDRLAKYLQKYGHSVARIHGDRSQSQREAALQGFRTGKFRILVATDIAARGIDVPHIAHVINYDLPQAPEDYVHRIGRTARAGATGEALCLLIPEDYGQWRRIARLHLTGESVPAHALREQSRRAVAPVIVHRPPTPKYDDNDGERRILIPNVAGGIIPKRILQRP